jgi:hypothetical protein
MPFDAAATETLVHFNAPAEAPSDTAALDAAWAVANPERALAFLMVAPQPCAALDALLDLPAAA